MSASDSKIFMTPKSSETIQAANRSHNITSETTVKTSVLSNIGNSWLTLVLGMIAVAGVVGTVGIAVVSFAFLRQTTSTTTTTTSTTSTTTTYTTTTSTTTTTPNMCFAPPVSRPSDVWYIVGNLSASCGYHTSTLISQDNSVLIAGGLSGVTPLISVQKYIPSTGCFQTMGNMPRARYVHTADQLPSLSGYVLFAGGLGTAGALAYADLFDPMTSYTLTIPLSGARYEHTSAILSSSELVLIGGLNQISLLDSADQLSVGSNSGFAYGTGALPTPCYGHTVTDFGDNSDVALITGGTDGAAAFYSTAMLYQGSTSAFITLPSSIILPGGYAFHTATYLAPPINKILILGGSGNSVTHGTMILFDIATLTFTTLNNTLIQPRYYHTATLLPNGKILVAGGYKGGVGALQSCELIDPSNNYTSTLASPLYTNRYIHTATLIPDDYNGTILVCGGFSILSVNLGSCELYFV